MSNCFICVTASFFCYVLQSAIWASHWRFRHQNQINQSFCFGFLHNSSTKRLEIFEHAAADLSSKCGFSKSILQCTNSRDKSVWNREKYIITLFYCVLGWRGVQLNQPKIDQCLSNIYVSTKLLPSNAENEGKQENSVWFLCIFFSTCMLFLRYLH